VDDSIEAQPEIYMEAGDHETLLHISDAQFARLMENARHSGFSEKLPHSISNSIVWGVRCPCGRVTFAFHYEAATMEI